MLITIAIVLGVLLAGILALAATRPNHFRIERSLEMNAPRELAFEQIATFAPAASAARTRISSGSRWRGSALTSR